MAHTRRSGARVEAADAALPCPFRALPECTAREVFALLDVRARLRSAAVCRAWLAALDDPNTWARCVLSPDEGGDFCTDDVLLAVSARARGALQVLDLAGCCRLTHAALLAVANANVGALRELRGVGRLYAEVDVWGYELESDTDNGSVEALLRAAPLLRVLDSTVACSLHNAQPMLRREAPFGPLALRELLTGWDDDGAHRILDEAALLSMLSEMASHETLTGVHVCNGDGANLVGSVVLLGAFADLALARRLQRVSFRHCGLADLGAHAVQALAHLVSNGSLAALHISGDSRTLVVHDDGAASPLLTALRKSTTLTDLCLADMDIWHDAGVGSAASVLQALTGHPSLTSLDLSVDNLDGVDIRGDELDACHALLAANAPALTQLIMKCTQMGNAFACALFGALPLNTHLCVLHCCNDDHHEPTAAFFRYQAVPAVRANTSLRDLVCYDMRHRGAKPAEALVAQRTEAAAAGMAVPVAPLARSLTALSLLPRSTVAGIFSLVPVDVRLRCKEVCFTWNMLLRFNPAVWASLDFSPAGGVVRPSDGMLIAAVAHACSKLELLDVRGCAKRISLRAVVHVCRERYREDEDEMVIRQLRVSDFHVTVGAEDDVMLRSVERGRGWSNTSVTYVEADVACRTCTEACDLLRRRHPSYSCVSGVCSLADNH
jgi:hypothetical protein